MILLIFLDRTWSFAAGGAEVLPVQLKKDLMSRITAAWGKFPELIITSRGLSCLRIYDTYMRSVLTNASECWALTVDNFAKIQNKDRAMIRLICNVPRLKTSALIPFWKSLVSFTLKQFESVWACSPKSRQHHTCRRQKLWRHKMYSWSCPWMLFIPSFMSKP